MRKLVTKKNVLFLAIFGSVIFYLTAFQPKIICGGVYGDCWDIIDLIWPLLLSALPLLFLSLITYKMRDEIFHTWITFAKWWVPLSVIAILVTPVESGGWISVPLQATMALFCAAALFVISLILITYKHFTLKKRGA